MVTLTFTTTSARAIDRLKAKAPIAQARALNRAIASAKTVMVREISQFTSLEASQVRDKIGVEQARPDRHRARLSASYKKIPLIQFRATGPEPSRGKGGGVSATVGGTRSRYPHAFIATMRPSGHRGVFQRYAGVAVKSRDPRTQGIRQRFGPSIAHVFVKFRAVGLARGEEQLLKNLQSEFRFVLSQTA